MAILRAINLAIRFLLELAALMAVSYFAADIDAPAQQRILISLAAPTGLAIFWGLFVSPKAWFPSGRLGQVGLGLLVFLIAAAALIIRGLAPLGITFACTAIVSSALLYFLPQ